jgi:hypothetical protein
MEAQGTTRRAMMRRTTTAAPSTTANDPHYLRTTISAQDETVARHMSQALKSERAIGKAHAWIGKGNPWKKDQNVLILTMKIIPVL